MSHVFHRHCHTTPVEVVSGDGPYLIDVHGKRYLDGSGGAAVSCLGHSHPAVIEAIKAQVEQLPFAHSGFFTSAPAEALADYLAAKAPGDLSKIYFVSGGSEAMEACLKLAYQYHVERGEPSRHRFITRRQSYHGNTLGALAIGGNQWRRQQFAPLLGEAHYIAPCYPYREQRDDETLEAYARRAADELETTIETLGPDTVAAFVCEPVVGATAGALPAAPGYLQRIREICDQNGVLLIFDEVMCGMGRTGFRFACEEDGVAPDLMAIAKGLGAGYQPIGAMLASQRIFDTLAQGSGFFQHGHTYMGHPTACAAALAVQRAVDDEELLDNVRRQGAYLVELLQQRFGQHPFVGDIRGRGLFQALEIVADRDSKAPFDPHLQVHGHIKRQAMATGLMCYPMGGTIDGRHGTHVLLAPPFILQRHHVEELVDKLATAMAAAFAAIAPTPAHQPATTHASATAQ